VLSAIFNHSTAAVHTALEVFDLLHVRDQPRIEAAFTSVCKAISGDEGRGLGIVKGEEHLLGCALAQIVTRQQSETGKAREPHVAMKGKYKPVAKKKNPVPVSVPIMKRQPYKPMPQPITPKLPIHPPLPHDFPYTRRLTQERVEIIVNNIPKGFLSDDEIGLLLWVIGQNEIAIAFDDSERGTYKREYFPDYVMETVPHVPWRLPPIRIPDAIVDEITAMLENQIANGNLEESTSSYRSRVFAVQKPKGGYRVVHDLQPLNEVSIQDSLLPPNVTEFAESFMGHAIYGTMDLYSGYHHRTVHVDSRPLTACQTLNKNVQLTSLPMGYTNSMQEFQRSTSHIIEPMTSKKARAFVDDLGTKGPTSRYNDEPIPSNPKIRRFVWEYAITFYQCLHLMGIAGATASGPKLVAATPAVTIVGYECDLEGMKPRHGIVTKVLNWPIPHNTTSLRGFLGTIGVARNWIKNYARIAKPLTDLTKGKQADFMWTDEAQRTLEILKQKVSEVTALKKMDVNLAKQASLSCEKGKLNEGRVIIAVDTAKEAVGYVLYQAFRNDDKELRPGSDPSTQRPSLKKYPLRYGSITLNDVESRYSQPKLELYGLFRALKALQHMVWGLYILVEADASFLEAMANSPGLPNAAATRWAIYIHLFNLEFKHTPAESHIAPDGLSRRLHAEEDTENTDIGDEFEHAGPFIKAGQAKAFVGMVGELMVIPDRGDLATINNAALADTMPELLFFATDTQSGERVEIAYPSAPNQDPLKLHKHHVPDDDSPEYWQNIISYLQTFTVPKSAPKRKRFIQAARKFFLANGVLWRRTNNDAIPKRVILEQEVRDELIRQAHEESGHRGRDPTYKKLSDFYFWSNMLAQVAIFCRTCEQCQKRSAYHPKVRISPTWVPTVLRKFNMDLVEMGIRSNGYEYIVDIRDDLTGWLEARMLARKSADAVADFLWQDVICRFGCIPQITTDNGTEFQGAVNALARRYNITVIRISPYNPAANGMIERSHRTWINSIWKLCGNKKNKWSRWFYPALWADRVTTRRTTGYSPYYLLYGKPHLFPYNITEETWYTIDWHGIETTTDLLAIRALQIRQMHADRQEAADRSKKSRVQAAEQYAIKNARRLISGKYAKGELVLVALKGPGIVRGSGLPKSADTWAGPFRITKRYQSGSYQLRELDGTILKGSVPAGHLKPFYTRAGQRLPEYSSSSNSNSSGEDQFEALSDGSYHPDEGAD
jgi:hypothetical protein